MVAHQVDNTNIPPRSAVGYLAMQFDTVGWAYGTGALINATNILTCSHNLIDQLTAPPPRGRATRVYFYPAFNIGHDGADPPANPLRCSVGFYSNRFREGQDAWDVAVCRLRNANVNLNGYFVPTVTGVEILEDDHREVSLTGYPGQHHGEMWEDVDEVAGVNIETNTMLYTNDTWAGNSGSPAWTYNVMADVTEQHGIHVSRQHQELRRGVLITQAVSDWINIALNTPTPQPQQPPIFELRGLL